MNATYGKWGILKKWGKKIFAEIYFSKGNFLLFSRLFYIPLFQVNFFRWFWFVPFQSFLLFLWFQLLMFPNFPLKVTNKFWKTLNAIWTILKFGENWIILWKKPIIYFRFACFSLEINEKTNHRPKASVNGQFAKMFLLKALQMKKKGRLRGRFHCY